MGRRIKLYSSCGLFLLDFGIRTDLSRSQKADRWKTIGKISTGGRVFSNYVQPTQEVSNLMHFVVYDNYNYDLI